MFTSACSNIEIKCKSGRYKHTFYQKVFFVIVYQLRHPSSRADNLSCYAIVTSIEWILSRDSAAVNCLKAQMIDRISD